MKESAQMEKITALRAAYAAFNREDMDAAGEPLDAQIEWSEPAEFPGGGSYQRREEVDEYRTQFTCFLGRSGERAGRIHSHWQSDYVYAWVRPKNSKE